MNDKNEELLRSIFQNTLKPENAPRKQPNDVDKKINAEKSENKKIQERKSNENKITAQALNVLTRKKRDDLSLNEGWVPDGNTFYLKFSSTEQKEAILETLRENLTLEEQNISKYRNRLILQDLNQNQIKTILNKSKSIISARKPSKPAPSETTDTNKIEDEGSPNRAPSTTRKLSN